MGWLKPDPVAREMVDKVLWAATRASSPANGFDGERRRRPGRSHRGTGGQNDVDPVGADPQPLPPEEPVIAMVENKVVQVDLPADVQQYDETGHIWTLRDEARDPAEYVAALRRAHLLSA
jgi:hypothetical protein